MGFDDGCGGCRGGYVAVVDGETATLLMDLCRKEAIEIYDRETRSLSGNSEY